MAAERAGELPIDPYGILLEFIYGLLAQLGDIVRNQFAGLLGSIGNGLSGITDSIGGALARLAGSIGEVVAQLADQLVGSIQQAIGPILGSLAELVTSAKTAIDRIIGGIETTVSKLWDRVVTTANSILDGLRATMSTVGQTIQALAQTVVATVVGWVNEASGAIRAVVTAAADGLRNLYNSVAGSVTSIARDVATGLRAIFDRAVEAINDGWRKLVEGTDSIIAGLEKRLGDLRTAFADASTEIVEGLVGVTSEGLEPIRDTLRDMTEKLFEWAKPAEVEEYLKTVQFAFEPHSLAALNRESAFAVYQKLLPTSTVGRAVWTVFLTMGIVSSLFGGISAKCGEVITQEWQASYLPSILNPAEAIMARRRGVISEEEEKKCLARHGYDDGTAYALRESMATTLSGFEVCTAWRRELISTSTRDLLLKAAGYTGQYAETLIALTEVLPPVSDLITFAVREVFSPTDAAALGLNEDFPEAFAAAAKRQGLSEENARRYWAAHWNLPSATQGFEMLHRGAISPDDLKRLLKAQDYSPVWRDALLKISYHPLTRVDVRRMHKTGVLKDEELVRAYLDLGYDQVNAERLAAFTVAVNRPAEQESADELGRLTRANILAFYRDRLLTQERAVALLVEAGLTPEAAALFVQAADLDEQRQDRQEEANLAIELAVSGAISESEAEDRLRRTGFEETETQRYLLKLARALERKTKLPTRAEAARMFTEGIITEGLYRDVLERLGYSAAWVSAFVSLAARGLEES